LFVVVFQRKDSLEQKIIPFKEAAVLLLYPTTTSDNGSNDIIFFDDELCR